MTRINDRQENQMRPIEIEIGVNKHAEGSALVKFGDTHVICTATIENGVPRWMRGSKIVVRRVATAADLAEKKSPKSGLRYFQHGSQKSNAFAMKMVTDAEIIKPSKMIIS